MLFCDKSSDQTSSKRRVETGNQGLSCPQHLRSIGLPLRRFPEKILHTSPHLLSWLPPCDCRCGPPPSGGRPGGGWPCRPRGVGKDAGYAVPPSNLPPLGGGQGYVSTAVDYNEGYSF